MNINNFKSGDLVFVIMEQKLIDELKEVGDLNEHGNWISNHKYDGVINYKSKESIIIYLTDGNGFGGYIEDDFISKKPHNFGFIIEHKI